jgi:hypothetical protein
MNRENPNSSPRRLRRWRFTLAWLLIAIGIVAVPLAFLSNWLRQPLPDETTLLLGKRRPLTWRRISEQEFRKLGLQFPAGKHNCHGGDLTSAVYGSQRVEFQNIDAEVLERDHSLRGHGASYVYLLDGRVFENGAYHIQSYDAGGNSAGYDKLVYDPDSRILTLTLGEESPRGFQTLQLKLRVRKDGELEFVSAKPDAENQPTD